MGTAAAASCSSGCIPLGAWGTSALLAPGRVAAGARGRRDLLPRAAAALRRARHRAAGTVWSPTPPSRSSRCGLARAAAVPPYAVEPGPHWRSRPVGQIGRARRRHRRGGRLLARPRPGVHRLRRRLGAGLAAGRARGRRGGASWSWRRRRSGVALVLAAPWVIGTAAGGQGVGRDLRTAHLGGHRAGLGRGAPLRHRAGRPLAARVAPGGRRRPAARSWRRGVRLVWAARLWVMACASWGLALAGVAGRPGVLRSVGARGAGARPRLAVAACVGLGISAFENDLTGREFGWRQVVSVAGLVCVAPRPPAGRGRGAADGRWDLPSQGVEQPLAFLGRPSTLGGGAGPVARRPAGAAGRRLVGPARPGLRSHARGAARRYAGAHAGGCRARRAGGRRRTPGGVGRDGAPGSAAGARPVCATWWWSTAWRRRWWAPPRRRSARRRPPGSTPISSSRTTCRSCRASWACRSTRTARPCR